MAPCVGMHALRSMCGCKAHLLDVCGLSADQLEGQLWTPYVSLKPCIDRIFWS